MEVCNDGHDEIVHTDMNCPLCEALLELDDTQCELATASDEATEFENEVEKLESYVAALESDLEDLNKED